MPDAPQSYGTAVDVELWRADRVINGGEMRALAVVGDLVGITSVSHTDGLTVLARAPIRVGVDVERVRPRRHLERLARRTMTDTEWEQWRASTDPVRAFVQHWTRVEAYLKAIGVGIRGGLRTRPDHDWTVLDLDVGREHVGALAVESAGRSVGLHWRT